MKDLILFIATVFLLESCKNPSTDKKNDKATVSETPGETKTSLSGFSIDAPEGWTKSDTMISGQQIALLTSPSEDASDIFRENVNVVTENTQGMGMDEYIEASLRALRSGLSGFSEEKISERNINGIEFKTLHYSHNYNGYPIEAEVWFTIKNNMAWLITCSAMQGEFDTWAPKFEIAVRSFHFK